MSGARLRDVRELPAQVRSAKAELVRTAEDVRLPALEYFSSGPCDWHAEPDPLCRDCGVLLRPHQRVGATWLYLAGKGLLADTVGSGKTPQIAAVLAMCRETGELGEHNRAVIICRAPAVLQWQRELRRMLPLLEVSAVTGSLSKAKRTGIYLAPWEIMVVSERTFAPASNREGDVEMLRQFPVGTVVFDDVDAMRTHRTRTARAVKLLAARASRVYGVNAEPLQKRIMELHSVLEPLDGREVLGSERSFARRFVKTGQMSFHQRAMICGRPGHLWSPPARLCPECGRSGRPDPAGRKVLRTVSTDAGVRNIEEFRVLLAPFVLRRTRFTGQSYPAIQPGEIWVDLNPAQRSRFDELRRHSLVRRWREAGEEVSRAQAAALFTRARQITSGTASLDEGRTDDSAKLDRVMRLVTGELSDEKCVVFVYFKPNVAALSRRLEAAGIGHVLMWSQEADAGVRDDRVQRFTNDPDCRVLVGTTTIAGSLNLQVARHLIAVDTVPNPAVMKQIAGRVQREGSAYETVFFHHLLARDTVDEGLLGILLREQAVADAVWGAPGDLFQGLSPQDMLRLVAGEAVSLPGA